MMPMKCIEIHQYTKQCPSCGWKPVNVDESARYCALIDHVTHFHDEMEEPRIFIKKLRVVGRFQECKVLLFGNRSYWRFLDRFPKVT